MSKSNDTISNLYRLWYFLTIFVLVIVFLPYQALARQAEIKKIQITHDPLSVKLFITEKIPVKVIQVEDKEVLVALKNVRMQKGFKILGKKDSGINVAVENLQGNVLAVILTGKKPYNNVKSSFNPADSSLNINLGKKKAKPVVIKPAPALPVKEKKPLATAPAPTPVPEPKASPAPEKTVKSSQVEETDKKMADKASKVPGVPEVLSPAQIPEELRVKRFSQASKAKKEMSVETPLKRPVKVGKSTVYVPGKREQSKFKGDISDLFRVIDEEVCDSKPIVNAILLLKKNMYKDAFNALDQYIFQENFSCVEQAYFLRAFAFYRTVPQDDFAKLLQAERMFQDALVAYPKSSLLPYGYAAIGIIQKQLNNISAAEGYFNIVKQGFLTYSGLPEIMYHLADIYDQKGYADKSLKYYKQVFEDSVENNYIADAGIGYGKGLFKKRQYLDSLRVLDFVVQTSPKKVYDSHELLLNIGSANFEVGHSKLARQNLNRVMNLFPEMEGRDVILSKIGDTYGMENNQEKAIKVYELVREKFPDSDGYIASSIGIARYLKKDEEKIEIYQMIKKKFPENTYSRIAMMRMAEIYQAKGEYNKCIKEIEDLLSTHPRGLRYEAVKLMQRAYEALFKKQLKEDEYTKVLNRYELEHTRIDRMGSRKIALSVGLAYLEGKLYDEAFNHLINAYKQYKRSSRSPQLLMGLGIAMDESGRKDDALKLFDAFSKRFPKSKQRGEALARAGKIYLDKKKYKVSSARFDTAYKVSKTNLEKGKALMMQAVVYEKKGDMKTASRLREKAVKEIALAPGENYDMLAEAYKDLGRTYVSLKLYVKSADAYSKALSFSADELEKANLGFLLGDAYQKGNIINKAKDAYEQVVESDDSVWARLAQQRLTTLELAQTVQNS